MYSATFIKTGLPEFDRLFPLVRDFLIKDRLDIVIDGENIRGYRSPDAKSVWIRDYSDMLRGARYFETDLTSTVTHFADTQAAGGRIFDYFTTFPEKLPCEKENWTKYVRVPVEADVEYRFVKAAFLAWQAACDDEWMLRLLPHLERALQYAFTHPWRIDKPSGLIKRAYTIDTWDFAYTAGGHEWLQFQIDDDTFWGIMHGDNSGFYEACSLMALLCRYFGRQDRADFWEERAAVLREALNRICWNGRFYTHFVKLSPVTIPGVDESTQLSLSNPMAVNRGAADHDMAVSIIREYRERGRQSEAFAEWFSIDPPFPGGIFGDQKLTGGAYINGGIMPLTGGELARAAFEHGFERYGADILRRYYQLISAAGETYLWYFPDGTPAAAETSTSPDAEPTDGWGSSAMLYALIEGLAGIKDTLQGFKEITLSPRWPAADVQRAEVSAGYAACGRGLSYLIHYSEDTITLTLDAQASVRFCLLLPQGKTGTSVSINGRETAFTHELIEQSRYACFRAEVNKTAAIHIELTAA